MINKPPINVQDGFFYQLRKDNTLVDVVLLSERTRARADQAIRQVRAWSSRSTGAKR